jgi:hypothetical protein
VTELVAVVESPLYLARAERLLSEAEREHIIDVVAADPTAGALIKGANGLRKMRIPLQGRGKRGGGRVVYWFHSPDFPVVLMLLFAKSAAADLTAEERKRLAALSAMLKSQLGVEE